MWGAADLWLALLRTQKQVGFWDIFIECQFFSESVDTNRGLPARSLSCDAGVCEGWPGCGLGEPGDSFRFFYEDDVVLDVVVVWLDHEFE